MKNSQATIKDIAKELNISPSTVSRALKNHPDISQETKKAVVELADKMEYQPNSIALSLRKSKSNTIGVIIPHIVHHFFSTIISGIEDVAHDQGYRVILAQSSESYFKELDNINTLISSRVDGLFLSLASGDNNYEHLKNLQKRNIPLVFFDRATDEIEASKVLVDDYDGAFLATEHLIEQGCQNIVHLAGPDNLKITENRRKGYEDALKKHHFALNPQLVVHSDNLQKAFDTISQMIQNSVKIDGIFTVNDDTAIGAIKAVKKMGLRIPEDIAVIGFGDDPICKVVEPNLSSVSQAGFEMGQAVANLFFAQMIKKEKGEPFTPETKILSTQLAIRESSKRI
jgi:DNA-binding LacI/PurR family transcriptional regulator